MTKTDASSGKLTMKGNLTVGEHVGKLSRVTLIGNYYLCLHIAQTVVGDAIDRTFSRKAKLVEILVDWGRGGW